MFRSVIKRHQSLLHRTVTNKIRCASIASVTKSGSNFSTLRVQKDASCCPHKHLGAICNKNFVRTYASYPDHIKVPLPALSPTMESGTIISWEKKEGDKVNEGDLLAEIETDKATMGFETPEEGYLAKIVIPAGTKDVPIGKLVCIIVQNEGDVAAFKNFKDDSPTPAKAEVEAPPPELATTPPSSSSPPPPSPPLPSTPPPTPPSAETESFDKPMTASDQRGPRVYASPMAKKLAEAQQLRLEGRGSGIHGSIKSTDLAEQKSFKTTETKASADAPQGGYIDIPVTNVRSVIAKRLLDSKQQIPHYYVTVECQMDKLIEMRNKINGTYEKGGVKLSVNDFIIKATAIACRKVPEANSYWMGNVIRQFDNVDVSVAVSTDVGLITPIIFMADRKGVIDISKEIKELAGKARNNKLKPEEFQGGTVCVSNLGMFGVTHFCAVINPPQACILAIGSTSKKLIPAADNPKGFKEVSVMNVTLSADHRVVDGAVAAKWLQHFRNFMEDPCTMIL